jgi:acyl carrier protein
MSEQAILDAISAFFRDRGKEIPTANADILESGIVDSMELLELAAHIESALSMDIPQERMTADNFRSIQSIVRTLTR